MEQFFDEILSKDKGEDLYEILGCNEHSTQTQVNAEYRNKVLDCHPDKKPGDKDAEAQFLRLKRAYEVLGSEEERKKYDAWRGSGVHLSFDTWKSMSKEMHQAFHWEPKEKSQQLLTNTTELTSKDNSQTSKSNFSTFSPGDPADSLISKFRNYEI